MPSGVNIMLLYHKNKAVLYFNFTSLWISCFSCMKKQGYSIQYNSIQYNYLPRAVVQSASKVDKQT